MIFAHLKDRVVTHSPDWLFKVVAPVINALLKVEQWVLYRYIKRYHIVRTKLKPAYYDIDIRMMWAIVALLNEYIDVECGGEEEYARWTAMLDEEIDYAIESGEYDSTVDMLKQQASAHAALIDAYKWFKYERVRKTTQRDSTMVDAMIYPNGETSLLPKVDKKLYAEYNTLAQTIEETDTEMLLAIVHNRGTMWT